MFLEQRINYFSPPQLNLASAGNLGQRLQWPIDRTWPIEEIVLHIGWTHTGTMTCTPAATPDTVDGFLQLLQRVTLTINDGTQPRNVIDMSGIALLEHAAQVGFNLDAATQNVLAAQAAGSVAAGAYRITYRIPMVNPLIGEPLRSRMYLPVHLFPQDPILTLTFNTAAGMALTVGSITQVYCDVQLVRRVPTPQSEKLLQATAPKDQPANRRTGYIPFDLIESPFSVGVGVTSEQRFALPIPGQYVSLLFRQYLGAATMTKSVIDNSGIGDTVAHGFGSESRWRLETGSVVLREWRWKHLMAMNDWSRTANSSNQTYSPNFGYPVLTNTGFRSASSTMLNFLLDGLSGDTGTELGSLLDCNTPFNNGLKMEVIGQPVAAATNAHQFNIVGHRLFGDLSRWSTFS